MSNKQDKLDNLNIYYISDYEFQKFIEEQRKRLNEQLQNVKPFSCFDYRR